ncbi:MAG: hypothetical protein Q9M91_01630 [Candidatus Dojkabacteria bacterium]|nr:hypothetical protein [Candidatus Dojkabacteria bacterium]MDQ7020525.1 hypothetical protein [Candidatus Dojkabacteria bacterium]
MKKLLIVVIVLVVILGAATTGAYFYASSNVETNALKANLKELETSEYTSILEATQTVTAETSVSFPLFLPEAISEETVSTTKYVAHIEADKASKVSIDENGDEISGSKKEDDIATFVEEDSPIKSYATWENLINDGKYELKETKFNGEDVWAFQMEDETLTEEYLPPLLKGFSEATDSFDLGIDGVQIASATPVYEGSFIFDIYVGKDDYVLKQVNGAMTDDVRFEIEYEGPGIDQTYAAFEQINAAIEQGAIDPNAEIDAQTEYVLALLQSFDGDIPEPVATITLSDVTIEFAIDKFELKDGKSMPTNPLALWIAMLIG